MILKILQKNTEKVPERSSGDQEVNLRTQALRKLRSIVTCKSTSGTQQNVCIVSIGKCGPRCRTGSERCFGFCRAASTEYSMVKQVLLHIQFLWRRQTSSSGVLPLGDNLFGSDNKRCAIRYIINVLLLICIISSPTV